MKEAIRYLGYRNHAVDEKTYLLIQECMNELEQMAKPKCVYRIFELKCSENGMLEIGIMSIPSKHLKQNLKGCDQVAIMCATLGIEVDNQMRKYEVVNMAKAVVYQACAAAHLEAYCDKIQKEISIGFTSRPRFSPGYGDFSILFQQQILDMLEASKRIGVSMTDGYMLIPTKSVTAVIGLYKTKEEKRECC